MQTLRALGAPPPNPVPSARFAHTSDLTLSTFKMTTGTGSLLFLFFTYTQVYFFGQYQLAYLKYFACRTLLQVG